MRGPVILLFRAKGDNKRTSGKVSYRIYHCPELGKEVEGDQSTDLLLLLLEMARFTISDCGEYIYAVMFVDVGL